MSNSIKITIDGKDIPAKEGQYIVEAAKAAGVYIPTLCNMEGLKPKGCCRVCSVMIDGRPQTACSLQVKEGMKIENDTAEINEMRKAIVEVLFAEGNHFCPSCERSGNCDLQALGYRFNMLVPRFEYAFPQRSIDASHPKIMIDHNRCIFCKRCIRSLKDSTGKSFFAFKKRGAKVQINVDPTMAHRMNDEFATQAMGVCPVGAIIKKGKGFDEPIGSRKYDMKPIGSDVEAGGR